MSKSITLISSGISLVEIGDAIVKYSNFYPEFSKFSRLTYDDIFIRKERLTVLGVAGRIEAKNGAGPFVNLTAVLAECECGNKIVTSLKDIKAGKIKSCGCFHSETSKATGLKNTTHGYYKDLAKKSISIKKEKELFKKKFLSLDNKKELLCMRKYYSYFSAAKKKGNSFELTPSEFTKIVNSNCIYCSAIPNPLSGIDRVDNTKGYIVENSVSCCTMCNYMKKNHNVDDFLNHVKKMQLTINLKIR